MVIDYEIVRNEYIRINTCYDYSGIAELPAEIDGLPVRELGAYAFSGKDIGQAKGINLFNSTPGISTELPPRICGNLIKEVYIPQSIRKIGRYAFYGCEELHTIHMYSTTLDLGNGIFMGCDKVRDLHVTVDESSRSSLHELLLMFCHPVQLRYYVQDEDRETRLKYLLMFPPYYENNDENTPARITFRDLHGSGLYYRNCFANTAFQIDRYDPLFAYAVANEEESITMCLALSRLIVDTGLKDAERAKYHEYIIGHSETLASSLLSFFNDSMISYAELRKLLSSDFITEAMLAELIEVFGRLKAAELLSLSMDIKKNRFAGNAHEPAKKRRRFEL